MNPSLKIILKTILCLGALALFLYLCFMAFIVLSISGATDYVLLLGIIGASVCILLPLTLYLPRHTRLKLILWGCLVMITAIYIAVTESINKYHRNIPVVSENDYFLYRYLPFSDFSKVARLEESPTLYLENDLPSMDGAKALYPVYAAIARMVYNEAEADKEAENSLPSFHESRTVACTNTINAYKRLIEGDVDIIFVAKPSEEQLRMAEEAGVEMKMTPIGKEAFVFFVNSSNRVSSLTTEQLKAIYSGRLTNWRQVGGAGQTIKAFQRNSGSGSQTMFLHFMAGTPVMHPPQSETVGGMGGIVYMTAAYKNYSNALGFSFRFFTQELVKSNGIKLLEIDGVYPSQENIENGTYPLITEFYAITSSTPTNPHTEWLVEWIVSPQGQKLIEKTGYTPVN